MLVSLSWLKELVDYKISDQDLAELLPLRTIGIKEFTQNYIELDMKGYNRADLLSMRGVALEVAAITNSQIKFDDLIPALPENLPKLDIEIKDTKLCPFYCLIKIENLKVGPSPKEWVKKLEDCGMRSVNNIADITNLVMLEYGQPLHSFDADKIRDGKIIVRTAANGEEIKTLDGKIRQLEATDLLIADSDKSVGIAGVMGGENSEVKDSTTAILLEAAIFDPTNLRATSNRLGLISEAGKRFYHGLTKQRLVQAVKKAVELYEELGGKIAALSIEDHLNQNPKTIELSNKATNALIGVEIPSQDIESYLEKLNFKLETLDSGQWEVTSPFYRLDIETPEDLIEEVARMYGYEKIPSKELSSETPEKIDQSLFETIYAVKENLSNEGLTEVQTYSFYSTEVLKNIGYFPDHLNALIRIINPISSETEYMRLVIWQNLLETVARNFKQDFEDMAIFEVGKMYAPKENGVEEDYDLAIALMNGGDNPIEELFEIVKKLTNKLNLNLELGDQDRGEIDKMLFHPTRFQHLLINGKKAGGIAEVHPRIVNKFGLDKRVAIVEVPLKVLL